MTLGKLTVSDLEVEGRRVFVRVDFNVPLEADGQIADDRRIRAAVPTLELLLERGATLVVGSHLGRPRGQVVDELRMTPVAARLGELLGRPVTALASVVGDDVSAAVQAAGAGDVILLENLRFEPGEEQGDEDLARRLASLCDVYVNDAFGAAHRAHASISGIPRFVGQSAAGLLMASELQHLGAALGGAESPFVLVFGGAKISDKVPVLRNLLEHVDVALVGGAMAYTFLAGGGVNIGNSRFESELVETAIDIFRAAVDGGTKFLLTCDHAVAERLEEGLDPQMSIGGVPDGLMGLDIGPLTAKAFNQEIAKARTILWNGPMGAFEVPPFDRGTRSVACAIAAATDAGAVSVVGGGDTAAAAQAAGVADRMTHVSTGGGAALELLEGRELPGVAALTDAPA